MSILFYHYFIFVPFHSPYVFSLSVILPYPFLLFYVLVPFLFWIVSWSCLIAREKQILMLFCFDLQLIVTLLEALGFVMLAVSKLKHLMIYSVDCRPSTNIKTHVCSYHRFRSSIATVTVFVTDGQLLVCGWPAYVWYWQATFIWILNIFFLLE